MNRQHTVRKDPLYGYTNSNKLANVRRYILKSNCLTAAEKHSIKEQVVSYIQQNESVSLKMNAVNNEIYNTLKQ